MRLKHPFLVATFVALAFIPSAPLAAQDAKSGGSAVVDAPKTGPFTILKQMDRLPVISQDSTGTCWSFGTVSFFESEVKRARGIDVDLSEMWWARAATVEKGKRYLESGGTSNFGEGGLSHDITFLMGAHGVVPQAVYTGLLDGKETHNHAAMFKMMRGAMDAMIGKKAGAEGNAEEGSESGAENASAEKPKKKAAKKVKLNPAIERALQGIADAYVGAPPTTFEFDGKTWDAKTFASDYLKLDSADYVELMSYGTSPFGGKAMLDVPDNWLKYDQYENVPLDVFMDAFDGALEAGYTVAIDVDVSEYGFNPNTGIAVLDAPAKGDPELVEQARLDEADPKRVTQERRDEMFKKKETTDDHLMHVVGVAKHEDGRKFYLTKNSWGPVGPYGGNLFMSEAYMRAKLLAFMVHRDAIKRKA